MCASNHVHSFSGVARTTSGVARHVDLPSSDSLRSCYGVGSLGVGSEVIEHVFISESGPLYGSSRQIRRRPAGLSMR